MKPWRWRCVLVQASCAPACKLHSFMGLGRWRCVLLQTSRAPACKMGPSFFCGFRCWRCVLLHTSRAPACKLHSTPKTQRPPIRNHYFPVGGTPQNIQEHLPKHAGSTLRNIREHSSEYRGHLSKHTGAPSKTCRERLVSDIKHNVQTTR